MPLGARSGSQQFRARAPDAVGRKRGSSNSRPTSSNQNCQNAIARCPRLAASSIRNPVARSSSIPPRSFWWPRSSTRIRSTGRNAPDYGNRQTRIQAARHGRIRVRMETRPAFGCGRRAGARTASRNLCLVQRYRTSEWIVDPPDAAPIAARLQGFRSKRQLVSALTVMVGSPGPGFAWVVVVTTNVRV